MAGLGKKRGAQSYGPPAGPSGPVGKKKVKVRIPSTHEVREHGGKVKTQPLPPGPKVRHERRERGEPVTAKERAEAAYQRRLEGIAGSSFGHTPIDDAAHAVGGAIKSVSPEVPGASQIRHAAEDEVKSVARAAQEHIEHLKRGEVAYAPSKNQALAGLTIASLAGGGEGVGEKALSKAVSDASNLETGAKAASKIVAKIKGAPKAAVRDLREYPGKKIRAVKETPKKIKAVPRTAKKAVTTAEGRRSAAKAAAKTSAKHPIRAGYAGAIVLPEGVLPGDATKRARAFAEGSWDAITQHPTETAKTTLRALPAAITGPVDLGAAAVDSAIHGTPEPLAKTAKEQAEGVGHILGSAFSGDPKKAEEAARKEGSLSILTPLPALSKTRLGRAVADDVRDVSSTTRRGLATTDKLPAKDWRNRNIRHAPKGLEEHATALSDRHFTRKRTAEAWQRIHNKHSVPADRHAGKILGDLAKAPKGSHVALQTVAEYGIRDKRGADYIREHGPGDAQLKVALDYMELHPDLFDSQAFKDAVKHTEEAVEGHPAATAGKGERARVLPQGDALGITRPEHMVPMDKRDVFGATSWAEAVDRLKKLRKAQRAALRDASPAERAGIEADIETSSKMLKEAKKGAKGKANVRAKKQVVTLADGTKRKVRTSDAPYKDAELREYVDKVEAARKEPGLAKAIWTHHSKADSEKGVDLNLGPTAAKKEYAREGHLAAEDNLDRSLEGLIRGTIQRPRYNAASKEFLQHIAEDERIDGLTLDGKPFELGNGSADWKKLTSRRTPENPDGGQIDPKSMTRFPLRQWENAIDDPFKTDAQRSDEMTNILKAARENRINGNEPWIPVRREALKEAEGQIHANHNEFVKFINAVNRFASRTLLATNPAWLIAQTVAEGIPMVVAHPSLLNPVHLSLLLKRLIKERRDDPERAMAVQAAAGAAPTNGRYLNTPIDEEGVMTPETWNKSAEAMTRGKPLKAVLSFAKLRTLPSFDIHRQNLYRELIYRAQSDKKFRKWYSGVTGFFDGAAEISKQFKGKTDRELQDWLQSDDPKAKYWNRKLTEHVDDVAGNWGAFTRFEKSASPFLIFYPFLRYSLRWALWAFPKSHPMWATVLALMGQANSNQLEELVGHPLENPAQYAEPVYTTANGVKATLPAGTRISPGQSSITQAAATGNPSALAQSLNPGIAAGAEAVFGVDPWTGEKVRGESQAQAALNELLALPTPLRIAGVKLGGGPSPGSQAFEQFNESKDLRSAGFPFIPQSAADFKGEQALSKAFHDKYGEGKIPWYGESPLYQKIRYGKNAQEGNVAGVKRELEAALKTIHAQEAGSDKVSAAEKPFFSEEKEAPKSVGELIDETFENAYKLGNKPKVKAKSSNPFGIPNTDASKLREQFGIPSTSASELRKQFGIG